MEQKVNMPVELMSVGVEKLGVCGEGGGGREGEKEATLQNREKDFDVQGLSVKVARKDQTVNIFKKSNRLSRN